MRPLLRAQRYVWQASPVRLLARILLVVAAGLVPVALAWLTRTVLDRIGDPSAPLLAPALALACAGVAAAMLPQLNGYLGSQITRTVTLAAKDRLFGAIGRLRGLARFEDAAFHDRLRMATHGTSGPADLVSSVLGAGQGALTIVGFLGTLAVLNPWMALVVVAGAVPTLRAELTLSRDRARVDFALSAAGRREIFYADLLTSVRAIKEVRLFGLGGLFRGRMLTELRAIDAGQRGADRRELLAQALLGVTGAVIAGGGLVWAVVAARQGRLSVGDVAVFVAAVAGVQGALATVFSTAGRGHHAMLMFGHYCAVVDSEPDLPPPASGQVTPVPELRHGIELTDVWFRYRDDLPWVLAGVDVVIPAGRATALVGLNGAGKSTLVKLLCRFYDPTRGSITWDGVDLRDFEVDELRRRMSVVFQDFMEYELSAAENIAVGDLTALDDGGERVTEAARRAGCDPFLRELPHGYDTLLTRIFLDAADRDDPRTGVVLSGGQWQRVALARALVRTHGDLLILDEPSAGLDAEAEHQVHERLRDHRRGRTSLLISHRMSTIRQADTIVVLGAGAVVERGGHDELITAGGEYARLFALQAAGYRKAVEVS
ncbi:ABC transporter ATP-binding protein [Actinoplanes derwentensis]|uniref:ATP-binding cassette, subfamily B n=1 Tax=Actinoplanes derwentensis TaxID=113562 RepID=A0A1H1VUN7_9ACTN|nr:ABC transporter ATP-binding protein [Actinoplanes derwentensis]GID83585.1 multidrug ABC transporter permease [Actinoplanes derwentensis]SDS88170.1 ATP-binding cassette, subfamily B [Actinoplanes derwentensis]